MQLPSLLPGITGTGPSATGPGCARNLLPGSCESKISY